MIEIKNLDTEAKDMAGKTVPVAEGGITTFKVMYYISIVNVVLSTLTLVDAKKRNDLRKLIQNSNGSFEIDDEYFEKLKLNVVQSFPVYMSADAIDNLDYWKLDKLANERKANEKKLKEKEKK